MLLSWHIGEAVQHTALSRQHSRVRIPYMSLSGEWGRNTEMSCQAAFFSVSCKFQIFNETFDVHETEKIHCLHCMQEDKEKAPVCSGGKIPDFKQTYSL